MAKKNLYGLHFGLVIVATTIALYAVAVTNLFKFPMAYISLFALVLSECVATAAFLFIADARKSIFVTGIFSAHSLLLFLISLVYINVFPLAYIAFTVIYLVSLTVCILAVLFLYGLAHSGDKDSRQFKDAKISMMSIRANVNAIQNTENGQKYRKELSALNENLRFTDDSVVDELDATINSLINELAAHIDDAEYDAKKAIDAINLTIQQRNFVVKNKKSYR